MLVKIVTLNGLKTRVSRVYLIDTNVISECRKGIKANNGVKLFFDKAVENDDLILLSVIMR